MQLSERSCVPCRGGVEPLTESEARQLLAEIPGWEIRRHHHLWRVFQFPDFQKALDFVNSAGAIAEREGHHPDVLLAWGKVEITIFTHSVDGLTESDFVLAAKFDRIQSSAQGE